MSSRYLICLLSLLLPAAPAIAQQPLQGQVTSDSSRTDFYNVYANANPLDAQPEQTPTTIGPNNSNRCIPPNAAWRLAGQEENTCYWLAPFAKPLNDYVVPMAKISWVESTGGTCGVNPFSNPDGPNATAVCDQPAPQDNPYTPPKLTPGSPGPDLYAANPLDPTRMLADYRQILVTLSHGNPAQLSAQYGPHLQQDMTACSKYAGRGILSSTCCTELGQAANMTLEGTALAQREAQADEAAAQTVCTFRAPQKPPIAGGTNAPHFYRIGTEPNPGPACQPWSPTEVICQGNPTAPPIIYQGGPPSAPAASQPKRQCGATVDAENVRFQKAMTELGKSPGGITISVMGEINSEKEFHEECLKKIPPPKKTLQGGTKNYRACVRVTIGNYYQDFNINLNDFHDDILGTFWKVKPKEGEINRWDYIRMERYPDGSYRITAVKSTATSNAEYVDVPVIFSGPC